MASKPHDEKRSPEWPQTRLKHLHEQPSCQACGATEDLEVHHMQPFHLHPELELVDSNLLTLCEKPGHDCHFVFGHFHNWQLYNPDVKADVTKYAMQSAAARGR